MAEHAIRQRQASEVKYVRGHGQAIPRTVVEAEHYLISPAFDGAEVDPRTLDWCIRLCGTTPLAALRPAAQTVEGALTARRGIIGP